VLSPIYGIYATLRVTLGVLIHRFLTLTTRSTGVCAGTRRPKLSIAGNKIGENVV